MLENADLVFVHGLLGSLSFFEPEKHLAAKVHTPDLWGYGGEPLKPELSLLDQVEYLRSYLEQHVAKPCWLLGHSVGGAIITLYARRYPQSVAGIINVEGNFTLNDAFWCQSIANKTLADWCFEYRTIQGNPQQWLLDCDIQSSSQRLSWAEQILSYQSAETVHAVAKAVVSGTGSDDYRSTVAWLCSSGIPVYLLAGEYSLEGWDIPHDVRQNCEELMVMKAVGHMMMLEQPAEFCRLIESMMQ